jgi:hypothetical protein
MLHHRTAADGAACWSSDLYSASGVASMLHHRTAAGLLQPRISCCAPPPSISNVGLNPTISPVTHWAQLFHHNHPCDLPKTLSRPRVQLSSHNQSPPSHIGPNSFITTIHVISRRRYPGPESNSPVTTIPVTRPGAESNSPVTTIPSHVGLNPTISPVTHWAQLFHHNHRCDLPKRSHVALPHHQFPMWD